MANFPPLNKFYAWVLRESNPIPAQNPWHPSLDRKEETVYARMHGRFMMGYIKPLNRFIFGIKSQSSELIDGVFLSKDIHKHGWLVMRGNIDAFYTPKHFCIFMKTNPVHGAIEWDKICALDPENKMRFYEMRNHNQSELLYFQSDPEAGYDLKTPLVFTSYNAALKETFNYYLKKFKMQQSPFTNLTTLMFFHYTEGAAVVGDSAIYTGLELFITSLGSSSFVKKYSDLDWTIGVGGE